MNQVQKYSSSIYFFCGRPKSKVILKKQEKNSFWVCIIPNSISNFEVFFHQTISSTISISFLRSAIMGISSSGIYLFKKSCYIHFLVLILCQVVTYVPREIYTLTLTFLIKSKVKSSFCSGGTLGIRDWCSLQGEMSLKCPENVSKMSQKCLKNVY